MIGYLAATLALYGAQPAQSYVPEETKFLRSALSILGSSE